MRVTDSEFTNNRVTSTGGAIYTNSITDAELDGLTFTANHSDGYGGAMANDFGTFTVNAVTFAENSADTGFGAWYVTGDTTLTDVVFDRNTAYNNPALGLYAGTHSITGGSFTGNTGTWGGFVAISACDAHVTLTNVAVGSGADVNAPNGVNDASWDLFTANPLTLACAYGECAGGASEACY